YEDAVAALARAAQSPDAAVRHQSLHNLGNTFFMESKLPEALEAYRRALEADPTDIDTKINYEKALRELQHQQQQKQQGEGKDDKQKQQDKGNSQQGQNDQQKQSGEQDQKQDQKPEPGKDQQTPEQQQQPGQQQQQQQDAQMQPANGDTTGVSKGEMRPEE